MQLGMSASDRGVKNNNFHHDTTYYAFVAVAGRVEHSRPTDTQRMWLQRLAEASVPRGPDEDS
jgi:hypothetical protein